jgi:hypothetical protein
MNLDGVAFKTGTIRDREIYKSLLNSGSQIFAICRDAKLGSAQLKSLLGILI